MSHDYGQCLFVDSGLRPHFEFNGTQDLCFTALKLTGEEVQDDWRSDEAYWECTCGKPPEDVLLCDGFESVWKGKACRNCMAIVGGIDGKYGAGVRTGHPEWYGHPLRPPCFVGRCIDGNGNPRWVSICDETMVPLSPEYVTHFCQQGRPCPRPKRLYDPDTASAYTGDMECWELPPDATWPDEEAPPPVPFYYKPKV